MRKHEGRHTAAWLQAAACAGAMLSALSCAGCTQSFDITPKTSAKIIAPERRGTAEGFKNDARLRDATRVLILMPDGVGAGVRDGGRLYNSGIAFLEAALIAQGRVPIVAARSMPAYAGSAPAACSAKTCKVKSDDMEYLLQMGHEARADSVLQLATPLDSDPVLARYVDAKTGDILLVGAFFAKPGRANVTRPPSYHQFSKACYKSNGHPKTVRDRSGVLHGECVKGPSKMSAWGWPFAVVGGVDTLAGTQSSGDTSTLLVGTGLAMAAVGTLLVVIGDRTLDAAEFQHDVQRNLPELKGSTDIAASRERTVAEALVAPLQGGAQ